MIDRTLNFGRHHVRSFLSSAGIYRTVLDIGAGQGDDLLLAREMNPRAVLLAVEINAEYAARLTGGFSFSWENDVSITGNFCAIP